jgi:membrane-associated phospholipid phosphatase
MRASKCIEIGMTRKPWVHCFILLVGMASTTVSAQIVPPCRAGSAVHVLGRDSNALWDGIKNAPRNAVRPRNLAWELPIGAATGVMIASVDRRAANRIQSKSLQDTSGTWSNVGLGLELGTGALGWTAGCVGHHSRMAEAGFTALTAFGAAAALDGILKATFNRQYPNTPPGAGKFWAGGKSFPSGHSATSFAFASTVAHRYPQNRWIKWGAYALASGVSLSRYPAKHHFPSDILVGATLGYVTGAYIATHTP